MSSSKASPNTGTAKTPKRALPSWMSARDDGDGDKQVNDRHDDGNTARGRGKGVNDNGEESENRKKSDFSKLMVRCLIMSGVLICEYLM